MVYLFKSQQENYLIYCSQNQIPEFNCSLWEKLKSDFLGLNYFWVSMIFVGFALTNLSRAFRWQIILKTMGYEVKLYNAYACINIAYLANLGLPRAGEFVRAAVFSKYEHIPFDKSFASVALDRIADMLSFFILVGLAFSIDPSAFTSLLGDHGSISGVSNKLNLLILLIILAGLFWFSKSIWSSWAFTQRIQRFVRGIWDGILSIKKLKQRNLFILHTILIWVWFFLMLVFAMKAFGPTSHLSFGQMLVVYIFGSFGVFIPSPGGMGTYHYLVILSLSYYGLQQADAFSFANIAFTSGQFMALVIFGTASLILLPLLNKKQSP
jgi:glycosyltransferase 2 family protein